MGQRMMIAIFAAIVGSGIAAAQSPGSQPAANSRAGSTREIVLSSEPSRATGSTTPATLREAAAANDYAAFDALVRKAKANGENLGAFEDLYEIWSYSQSSPTGAYYGARLHDRLAARYPDYGKFIVEFTITDSHHQPFYPSAETRRFLLQQAIEGNDPIVAGTAHTTPAGVAVAAAAPVAKRASVSSDTARATATSPIEPPETLPADALASDMSKVTPQQRTTSLQPKAIEAEMVDTAGTTRGIFLVILGLVGIGVLTMTVQASSSEGHVADDEDRPQTPVAIATAHDVHPTESHG